MATDPHASAHNHAPGDHVPHVLPLSVYFGVFFMLIVFTVLTVAVSYLDLGSANLFIAMLIAVCKASMVAAIFMHLAFDKKFNAVIFVFSVVCLAIFITLTMFDTDFRGLGGRVLKDKPADVVAPFSGTKHELAIKERWAPKATQPGVSPAPAPAP